MSKAVLISVKPRWCELIANHYKTIEVRKAKPKLKPPFKCYIYCTNARPYLVIGDVFRGDWYTEHTLLRGYGRKEAEKIWDIFNGGVMGEFICDNIETLHSNAVFNAPALYSQSFLTREEFFKYAADDTVYFWHISKLETYDMPKELGKFTTKCHENCETDCYNCEYYQLEEYGVEYCSVDGFKPLKRPPQSWCYVEEVKR